MRLAYYSVQQMLLELGEAEGPHVQGQGGQDLCRKGPLSDPTSGRGG